MEYNISIQVKTSDLFPAEFSRFILETQHWRSTKLLCALEMRDPPVPTSYDKVIVLPLWTAAITTELGNFCDHNCAIHWTTPCAHEVNLCYQDRWCTQDSLCRKGLPYDPLGRLQPKEDLLWQHHSTRHQTRSGNRSFVQAANVRRWSISRHQETWRSKNVIAFKQ